MANSENKPVVNVKTPDLEPEETKRIFANLSERRVWQIFGERDRGPGAAYDLLLERRGRQKLSRAQFLKKLADAKPEFQSWPRVTSEEDAAFKEREES